MDTSDLSRLSDDEFRSVQGRVRELVPEVLHTELFTYEQAADKLEVKYERIATLVSQGVFVTEKRPRDARKYLSSDQIAWYERVRQGMDDLPNPARVREEALRRSLIQGQSQSSDTLAELRNYVTEHMAGTDTATQLNTILAAIASHITGTLIMESLPGEERESLAALLSAIIQKGR